ncbi:MAG: 2-amino-4-hydroxy-6-hydroxymethyldihydropteridine diphosphokinase [Lachnospiraceae bacterium]|nr:2-amino-4-hydroxy-6-hydroxymethyldihydropteridine diphosphokinase [Lachnospiraceae bacterium]
MNHFVISLGSNSSDRCEKMEITLSHLKSVLQVEECSEIYETLPWGGGDRSYVNCVIAGSTTMDMESLNSLAKQWEMECGRNAETKRLHIVPIDIDIVIWNDAILRPKELTRDYFLKGYDKIFH